MPTFMGQGICAGLRDVWNLEWKLDRVLSGRADASLLDSYEPERKPHVTQVIEMSIFLGSIICIPDAAKAAERDAMFTSGSAPPMAEFPYLTDGFVPRDAAGGLLGPAGLCAGAGWQPVGRWPAACAVLDRLGVSVANVAPCVGAPDDRTADTQGQFLPFMQAQGVHALLVRPDFYLLGGAATLAELEQLLAQLDAQARQVGLAPALAA